MTYTFYSKQDEKNTIRKQKKNYYKKLKKFQAFVQALTNTN